MGFRGMVHITGSKGKMRMKAVRWMLPILFLFFATSAFAQKVSFTFDKVADFSKYKTYRWEKHPLMKDIDQSLLAQLGAAFDAALVKSGLTKSPTKESDLVIVYTAGVDKQMDMTTYATGWYAGPGWNNVWYGNGMVLTSTTSSVDVGSVSLDMFDRIKQELVWRGVVSKTVEAKSKPEKRQQNITKAAEKLLKNYPPKTKK
jgi:hypothetical protein